MGRSDAAGIRSVAVRLVPSATRMPPTGRSSIRRGASVGWFLAIVAEERSASERRREAARIAREREVRLSEIERDRELRRQQLESELSTETAKVDNAVALAAKRIEQAAAETEAHAARAPGPTVSEVGEQLRSAYDGRIAQIFQHEGEEIEVRVVLPDRERNDIASLENLDGACGGVRHGPPTRSPSGRGPVRGPQLRLRRASWTILAFSSPSRSRMSSCCASTCCRTLPISSRPALVSTR